MEDLNIISVKGMVCDRCKQVLTRAFKRIGLEVKEINLGSIKLLGTSQLLSLEPIQQVLQENGFDLLLDSNSKVVQDIKRTIDEVLNQNQTYGVRLKFFKLLADKLHMDYDKISAIFSSTEGMTLEKYIIHKRLEKVKELLVYTDFTLTEIAYLTGYSSIQHLSNQFKELTGLSPSYFREVKAQKEKLSDSIR